MNLDISGNLRRLRSNKKVTQEDVAKHLGVSPQAVSKWERGDGYPDITLLLPIASYFGVSADQLLGMDKEKENREVNEILERATALIKGHNYTTDQNRHLFVQSIEIIAQGAKEFPNNFDLMSRYAICLQYDHRIDDENHLDLHKLSFEINGDEIEHICRRILQECTDSGLRHLANVLLVRVYAYRGDTEKALELCKDAPSVPYSKLIAESEVYDFDSNAALPHYRKIFHQLFRSLIWRIDYPIKKSKEEMAICWEKTIELCDVFFDNGEYGEFAKNLCIWCLNLSLHYKDDPERVIKYVNKAFQLAKHEDDIYNSTIKYGRNYVYTSFLARGVELDPEDDFVARNRTAVQNVIDLLEERDLEKQPYLKPLIEENRKYGGIRDKRNGL